MLKEVGAGGVTHSSLSTSPFLSWSMNISFKDDVTVSLLLSISFMLGIDGVRVWRAIQSEIIFRDKEVISCTLHMRQQDKKSVHTAKKIPCLYSFSRELRGLNPNFHIPVSVSVLYIPRIGGIFSCSRIGRSIVGIYSIKSSQTHECGNWDCCRASPFLGICVSKFQYWFFVVQALCIVLWSCVLGSSWTVLSFALDQVRWGAYMYIGYSATIRCLTASLNL